MKSPVLPLTIAFFIQFNASFTQVLKKALLQLKGYSSLGVGKNDKPILKDVYPSFLGNKSKVNLIQYLVKELYYRQLTDKR